MVAFNRSGYNVCYLATEMRNIQFKLSTIKCLLEPGGRFDLLNLFTSQQFTRFRNSSTYFKL